MNAEMTKNVQELKNTPTKDKDSFDKVFQIQK